LKRKIKIKCKKDLTYNPKSVEYASRLRGGVIKRRETNCVGALRGVQAKYKEVKRLN
tara:strand:- start:321 stop:491 length:171 start_codon:yes stop_codon:yes gene_type:complete